MLLTSNLDVFLGPVLITRKNQDICAYGNYYILLNMPYKAEDSGPGRSAE